MVSTAGVGEWGVQTGECKTGSRVHYTTWGIDSVYCNNCKWKITFKIALKIKKKRKVGSIKWWKSQKVQNGIQ